jgi:microcystin-dependent protein
MDDYLAEIRFFGGNFAPRGWMLCAGQILPIAQYTALFSLLGTYYGGNGTTNFALPNLQSRVAVGCGQGTGLSFYYPGQQGGSESIALLANNMPAHTHAISGTVTLNANATSGNTDTPYNSYPAVNGSNIYNSASDGSSMPALQYSGATVGVTGNSTPVSIIQPVLALTAIISISGAFPARN